MKVEEIVALLRGAKSTGDKQWEAYCPAHEQGGNHRRSLAVGVGEKGKVVLCCHAGCTVEQVVEALGLTLQDLFPAKSKKSRKAPGKPNPVANLPQGVRGETADGPPRPAQAPHEVAAYDYTTAAGELLFQVVRMEPKDFRQRRPDGNGGWIDNMNGTQRILYRLPELLAADAADVVFIVEGEKDVETAERLGIVATCNPGGAGKWSTLADDKVLEGRLVCIIADADDPGRKHAADVAERLFGRVELLRVIELPDAKDLTAWTEQCDCRTELELVDELHRLVADAPDWEPADRIFYSYDELCAAFPDPAEPVIDGLLRRGEVATIVGASKSWKSWLALQLAVQSLQGGDFLGWYVRPSRTMVFDFELSGGILRHRIDMVSDALDLVAGRRKMQTAVARGKPWINIDVLPNLLRRWQLDLLILDPTYRLYGEHFDENSNADMARLYADLQALAEEHQAAVVVVHHLSKGSQFLKSTIDLGAGAGAMARSADVHLGIRDHEEDQCAVVEGVVRSFKGFEPFAIRRQHPIWIKDGSLDPAKLRKPGPKESKEAAITPLDFAIQHVGTKRKSRSEILMATKGKIARNAALDLLNCAVAEGFLKRVQDESDKRIVWFELAE